MSSNPRTDDGPLPATSPGGALLHKGFYDIQALIAAPVPSRFFWGASAVPALEMVAGPRHDDQSGSNNSRCGQVSRPYFTKAWKQLATQLRSLGLWVLSPVCRIELGMWGFSGDRKICSRGNLGVRAGLGAAGTELREWRSFVAPLEVSKMFHGDWVGLGA
ncbi:hypothetical protein BJY52DRAFT_1417318 [Lactarius psammicola]|nr:hypothetical protein BJY52DRAFT_1417318 [Lactarius psammicola]